MKRMIEKLVECLMALLPFLQKKEPAKGFNEMIMSQYSFLIEQLEKVLKDYFQLSAQMKELHGEIFSLKEQLAQALSERCCNRECDQRTPTDW